MPSERRAQASPQGAGESERVDHRGEHSHPVAGDPLEALSDPLQAAEDVPSSVHDGYLVAGPDGFGYLVCVFYKAPAVDAAALGTSEAFAAEFKKYSHIASFE